MRISDWSSDVCSSDLIEPNNADAWSNLGLAYHQLKQYPNAIAAYRQALELDPDHANTLVNLGNSLARSGNDEEAIDSYRNALRIDSENLDERGNQIGRASCRERVCQYG